jgi:hypothetical protein
MIVVVPTQPPMGPYANGAEGPSSVLVPRGYNFTDATDIALLNRLSLLSGTMQFQVSSSNESLGERRMDDLAESADLAQAYFGSFGIDTSSTSLGVNPYVSPIVYEACFTALAGVGMTYCNTIADCIAQTEEGPKLNLNHKFNFLFQVIPYDRGSDKSTIISPNGIRMFSRTDRGNTYGRDFFRGFLEVKNRRDGGLFSNLDVLMSIPTFAIPDLQMDAHVEACEIMSSIGPGCSNMRNAYQLSLKQAYAHHFLTVMSSEIVATMMEKGWAPLWLMKNCLLAKTDRIYAPSGYYFSSLDKTPKSYLHLVGFFRGTKENNNLCIVTLTNNSNQFLRIAN